MNDVTEVAVAREKKRCDQVKKINEETNLVLEEQLQAANDKLSRAMHTIRDLTLINTQLKEQQPGGVAAATTTRVDDAKTNKLRSDLALATEKNTSLTQELTQTDLQLKTVVAELDGLAEASMAVHSDLELARQREDDGLGLLQAQALEIDELNTQMRDNEADCTDHTDALTTNYDELQRKYDALAPTAPRPGGTTAGSATSAKTKPRVRPSSIDHTVYIPG